MSKRRFMLATAYSGYVKSSKSASWGEFDDWELVRTVMHENYKIGHRFWRVYDRAKGIYIRLGSFGRNFPSCEKPSDYTVYKLGVGSTYTELGSFGFNKFDDALQCVFDAKLKLTRLCILDNKYAYKYLLGILDGNVRYRQLVGE